MCACKAKERTTCRNKSKGLEREGVPVNMITRLAFLQAMTATSVMLESWFEAVVLRLWLSSMTMTLKPVAAKHAWRFKTAWTSDYFAKCLFLV